MTALANTVTCLKLTDIFIVYLTYASALARPWWNTCPRLALSCAAAYIFIQLLCLKPSVDTLLISFFTELFPCVSFASICHRGLAVLNVFIHWTCADKLGSDTHSVVVCIADCADRPINTLLLLSKLMFNVLHYVWILYRFYTCPEWL